MITKTSLWSRGDAIAATWSQEDAIAATASKFKCIFDAASPTVLYTEVQKVESPPAVVARGQRDGGRIVGSYGGTGSPGTFGCFGVILPL